VFLYTVLRVSSSCARAEKILIQCGPCPVRAAAIIPERLPVLFCIVNIILEHFRHVSSCFEYLLCSEKNCRVLILLKIDEAVVEVGESSARVWPFGHAAGTVGLAGFGTDLMVLYFFCDFPDDWRTDLMVLYFFCDFPDDWVC
jgi:hypothetical protein